MMRIPGFLLLAIIGLLFFCSPGYAKPITLAPLSPAQLNELDLIIGHLSIEEKIGQLLMVGFLGETPEEQLDLAKTLIHDYHVGGIILFSRNFTEPKNLPVPQKVAALTDTLQGHAASRSQTRIPLLIAADQENGAVLQVKRGITILPSAMALGATRDEEYAFQAGRITASELSLLGINMILAPVADVHNNGDNDIIGTRSFGSDVKLVERMSLQFMRGLQQGGTLSVVKHFPGHGGTDEDPHETLPLVSYDRETIMHKAKPFFTLAREGANALMTTHMEFKAFNLGRDIPISLSERGVKQLVRNEMDFPGVVLPDDLSEMQAARKFRGASNDTEMRSHEKVARMAVEASSDLLIYAHIIRSPNENRSFTLNNFERVVAELKTYFTTHPEQLNNSVRRILSLKLRFGKNLADPLRWQSASPGQYDELLDQLKQIQKEHEKLSQEMTDAAILKINDAYNMFSTHKGPLTNISANDRIVVVAPVFLRNDLLPQLRKHFDNIDSYQLNYGRHNENNPLLTATGNISVAISKEQLAEAIREAKLVVFGLINRKQGALLEDLYSHLKQETIEVPIVAISYHEPNLLDYHLIREISYLASFSNSLPANESVYRALRGELKLRDRKYLPVTIPQIFPDFQHSAPLRLRPADLVIVTPKTGPGGIISPATEQKILRGQQLVFTINANSGFQLKGISGCKGERTGNKYTIASLEEDCTVSAEFQAVAASGPAVPSVAGSKNGGFHPTLQAIIVIIVILVCLGGFMYFLKKFVFPEPDIKREAMIFVAMLVLIIVALLIFKEISPDLFARLFGQIVDKTTLIIQ